MPRLIIAAVAAATLIFVPSARASLNATGPTGYTNHPEVSFSRADADTGPIECGLKLGAVDAPPVSSLTACTSPWEPPVTVDGDYTVEVSDHDSAYVFHFFLDRTGPKIEITTGPADNTTQISAAVVYGFTLSDDRGVATTMCTWDAVPAACPDGTTPVTLGSGTHVLTITSTDSLGNRSALSRHVTIAAPQLIVDPGPTPTPTATPAPDVIRSQGGVLSAGATHATASLSIKKRTRGWTQLRSLTLRSVPAGTTIKVVCKGKGCPSRPTTQKAARSGSITIKGIAGRRLRPGARITLTLSQPSAKPQTIRILVRSTRAPQVS